ncbi:MAG: hypothetical protein AAFR84_12380 [Pseudomonadota bacterium]
MADGVMGRPTSGTGPEESVPTAPTGVPDLAQVLGGRCVKRGCFNAADQAALEAAGARPADPALLRGYTDSAAAEGIPCVCAMMRLDARLAEARGDTAHAADVLTTLAHYLRTHPTTDCS